jgi:hypothetical protein
MSVGRGIMLALLVMLATAATTTPSPTLPPRYWGREQSRPILDKTAEIRLQTSTSDLRPGERACARLLLEAGQVVQHLYETSLHPQALSSERDLVALDRRLGSPPETRDLIALTRLFEGPIATTLDNRRLPMLPVDSLAPGKTVYPWRVTRDEIDRYLAAHPGERAGLMDPMTVVRRADATSIAADLATLARHPGLTLLHPRLESALRARKARPDAHGFYAVPYALAYADSFAVIVAKLRSAADTVAADDPAFANYLRQRARDLFANDYEAGDAAWVTSTFGELNAQIGAYESYDDELFGVKAFFGFSLMRRDSLRTAQVRSATRGLQKLENALPYGPHKTVREDIPVVIADVLADFGQCRGTNTATILPNDSDHARRYGRIIMMRRNIIVDSVIVASARDAWNAAVAPAHVADFDPEGAYQRTLWHELGHYLGPDRDPLGRPLPQALHEDADTFEEMKADLVALFVGRELQAGGYYTERALRGLYASGVGRMLQKTRPRPDQAYGIMQLMQFNWFLERGALEIDPSHRLVIHYDRYHDTVAGLLKEILAIQAAGDSERAKAFRKRWTTWDERHEAIAAAMRASETSRFRLVRYAALGE